MTRKSDGEKIDELEKLVAVVLERLQNIQKTLDSLGASHREESEGLDDLQRRHETEIAVFKKEIEEIRRWIEKNGTSDMKTEVGILKEKVTKIEVTQERVGNRAWSIIPNVVGAIINGLIAAIVAYSVAKR